jgi:hypothetical protein
LPYTPGPDGTPRPYVVLEVVGPNDELVRLRGLLDTGSDRTLMPSPLLQAFGYRNEDLEPQEVRRSFGSATLSSVRRPLRVAIAGEPSSTAELRPLFAPDLPEILLGRDFMATFNVSFVERDREFALFWR